MAAEAPASPGGGSHESGEQSPRSNVREQDRYLPIANISRIMKKALPANGKIAKDAKETVQECVSEFISFITSEASDKCQREKRKTINGDDLLWAMATLGFEDYIDPLKIYLTRYREIAMLCRWRVTPRVMQKVEMHLLRKMVNQTQTLSLLIKAPSRKVLTMGILKEAYTITN
ncbi:nuclear transcription factor Y subunit B-10 [Citrus sinensis]|uniref:Nuclear transcription factor Y subunit B-10 n=1 Tax=Citrus sinensis TaxID=2711 RepID=A0ACB8JTG6_CITSI|nr:nuclear transcription factor Y subunit B-1 isoform X1 [Citrus sinensis]XP_052299590.1 nuclear transcription factor Y subunit B-1 isoform X1 [Citrus sinensis]KAH9671860.1 nuclear transcription factor Y subunit B-10 [Citrus sinensis]KAH9735482.1 nuclear transcription factor Y subunit B-10 [Citrus sinensis]